MIITNQSVELFKHDKHPYEFIEQVARICYKSEDKIVPGSAVKMIKALVNNMHYSMLEHEYLYYRLDYGAMSQFITRNNPNDLKYINITTNYISGSFRAFKELFDKKYLINNSMRTLAQKEYPEVFGEPEDDNISNISLVTRKEVLDKCSKDDIIILIPHTIKFVTNRAVSHELVRHRAASYAQSSQRYVDYGSDKYNSQITVIHPHIHETDIDDYNNWHYCMLMCETQYMNLRKSGIPAEIARGVLPNDCKTEIVVTATEEEWQHIVNLRYHGTTGRPHPQMYELMSMAFPVLQEESNKRII